MYNIASNTVKKVLLVVVIFSLVYFTAPAQTINAFGQQYSLNNYTPPPVPDPVCAYCNYKLPNHAANCPYNPKNLAAKKTNSTSLPAVVPLTNQSLSLMVAGTLMQGLLNGIFSSNEQQKQQQQIAEQQQQMQLQMQMAMQKKIKDSMDNLNYLKLMSSYKQLQGAQELSLKASSSQQQLDFKKLDGDDESMRADAGKAFDGNTISDTTGGVQFFQGTDFFNSNVAKTDIYPERDSVMLDVNNADKFLKEHEISDSAKVANLKSDIVKNSAKNNPEKKNIDCPILQQKLNDYIAQRDKFHKTIISTQTDLVEWQNRNNEALWNAAYSGAEFLFDQKFGDLLKKVEERGDQAENVRERLIPYMDALRKKGVNVDSYLKTLNARIFSKDFLAKDVETFKDAAEYDAFFRDAIQAGIMKVAETDSSYDKILKDNSVKIMLNTEEHPGVDAGQFVAGKGLEKLLESQLLKNLLKFDDKIPYVKYAQLAVDEAYNAYDWYLSYQRIKEAHETSGKELQAAAGLQMLIDKTIDQVKGCPVQ